MIPGEDAVVLTMVISFCLTLLFLVFKDRIDDWFAGKTRHKNISLIVKKEIEEAISWELKYLDRCASTKGDPPENPGAPPGHYPEWHSQGMIDGLNRALTILKRYE